jgi:hypothetical protein
MEKAYAAFAAADAGRASYAAVATVPTATDAGENVEHKPAESVIAASVNAFVPATEVMPTAQHDTGSVISGSREGVAYAAAASGSASSESVSAAEVPSHSIPLVPPEIASHTSEDGDKQREAELAAAWQNWKQIRESIVGSQLTAQIADAAATELKDVSAEEPSPVETENADAATEPESDEPSNTAGESTAIASIVDSVLAELKPRLMEEIAKKMNTEKKEKEKKKKK